MDLNQVTLPAFDIEESKEFYRRMGFLQIVESPGYARFECTEGDATFSLLQVDAADDRAGRAGPGVTVYFESSNLDSLCAELESRGMKLEHGPRDEKYLWREARLYDPSGNAILLYFAGENRKNPPWRIGGPG